MEVRHVVWTELTSAEEIADVPRPVANDKAMKDVMED